jgi:DNA-binding XRE family transcriptional regulator
MGYTVRQARMLADKSQSESANAIGVCLQTYRKLEKNPEKATIEQAKTLSRFFGLPYDAIFFDNNSN